MISACLVFNELLEWGEAFRAELNYQDDLRQQKLQENPFLIASYRILMMDA
jgi:hypothetical protein